MSKIILKAQDLDGLLTEKDNEYLARMDSLYRQAMVSFNILSTTRSEREQKKEESSLIELYNTMGSLMQEICAEEPRIQVYSFTTCRKIMGKLHASLRSCAI